MTKSSLRVSKRSYKKPATLVEQLQKLSTSELKVMLLETNKAAAAAEWDWMQLFAKLPASKKSVTAYFEPFDEEGDEMNEVDKLRYTEKNMYIKCIARLKQKVYLYSSFSL